MTNFLVVGKGSMVHDREKREHKKSRPNSNDKSLSLDECGSHESKLDKAVWEAVVQLASKDSS